MATKKTKAPATKEPRIVISAPSPNRKLVYIPPSAQDLPTIYANNANVEASNWDVKIKLGLIQNVTPDELQVKDIALVYMSHEHAKAFSDALAGIVAKVLEMKKAGPEALEAETTH